MDVHRHRLERYERRINTRSLEINHRLLHNVILLMHRPLSARI
jgi:hypothetical protein